MKKAVPQCCTAQPRDTTLSHGDGSRRLTGAHPVPLEDLTHELRQPLGIIDSLAFYLELTAADEKSCAHLRHIRAMVNQTNRILERAEIAQSEIAVEAVKKPRG
jgi:nitrogen-specific signal transduction histidine kinase